MSPSFINLTKSWSSFVNRSGFGDDIVNARSIVIPRLSKWISIADNVSESNMSRAIRNFPTENSFWLNICFFINFSTSSCGSVAIRVPHFKYSMRSRTPWVTFFIKARFSGVMLTVYKDKMYNQERMSDVLELKILIQRVLLPRIRQLEEEVATLRKHTWPYVQNKREKHQLDDIEAKRDFFKHLDDDTIKELLLEKAKLTAVPGFHRREYDLTNNFCWCIINDSWITQYSICIRLVQKWQTHEKRVARRLHLWHFVFYDGSVRFNAFAHQNTPTDNDGLCMLVVL